MDKKLNSSELLAEIMKESQVKNPELKAKQLRLLQKLRDGMNLQPQDDSTSSVNEPQNPANTSNPPKA